MLAVDPGNAQVLSGFIAGLSAIVVAVIGVQWKVHRDNRNDHGETARKVDQLLERQTSIALDITEVKADVREVKADVRDLKDVDRRADIRITALEDHQ